MNARSITSNYNQFQAPMIDQDYTRVWISNQLSIYKYDLLSEYAMECEHHILVILSKFLRLIAIKKQDIYVVNRIDELDWFGFI
jgi:hypothetical protein